MNLGRAIRLCRLERGVNQSALAERADVSVSYLSLLDAVSETRVFPPSRASQQLSIFR